MASTSDVFGFELLYKLHQTEIQKKQDVIILLVHWYLVKHGLRCVGTGDNISDHSQKGSELLPSDWSSHRSYTLRYVKNDLSYILTGIKSDEEILLNLVKIDDHIVSNIAFPIEKTVSALSGSLETMIPSYEIILHQLRNDFFKPMWKFLLCDPKNFKEIGTQINHDDRPARFNNPQPESRESLRRNYEDVGSDDLYPAVGPDVGLDDLYPAGPFGGGSSGSGMLFNPFERRHPRPPGLGIPGRLPPGAIPPGARFDPFGPPDLDPLRPHRRRPGDDHLPPPGFDDMFM